MRKENRFRIFDLFAPGRTQDPADSPQPEDLLDSPRFSGFSETAPDFSIGAGYELENAKRQKAYQEAKSDMEKLVSRVYQAVFKIIAWNSVVYLMLEQIRQALCVGSRRSA